MTDTKWIERLPIYCALEGDISTYPYVTTSHTYLSAFDQWKFMRDQLSATVQGYASSCASLASACSQLRRSNRAGLERALTALSEELPLLAQDEIRLFVARAQLTTLRNQSASISPISVLPPEILARIFVVSSLSCVHDRKSHKDRQHLCPTVFASVCTSWRHIALENVTLWNHIDVIPVSNPSHKLYKRARTWLSRARNAPLHVHIHEKSCSKDEDIAQLVGFLSPYTKHFSAIYVDSECHTLDLFEFVLACWLEHGSAGSMKTLMLRRPQPIPLLASLGPQELRRLPAERLQGFLQPLRVLHLYNVCIGWGASTAHQGLVELQIESIADASGPTLSQLVAVLCGCSRLQKLKLARMKFKHEDINEVPSVQLPYLQDLNLLGAHTDVLRLLLPNLDTGDSPLSMSISLGAQSDLLEELGTFFHRSNLCTLFIDTQRQNWTPRLFCSLKHLQTLVISNFVLTQNIYTDPTTTVEADDTHSELAICASLSSLFFIGCHLALGPLQNMLKAHPTLTALDLWRSKLSIPDTDTHAHDVMLPGLANLVPRVTHSNCPKKYPMLGWYVSDEHDVDSVRVPL